MSQLSFIDCTFVKNCRFWSTLDDSPTKIGDNQQKTCFLQNAYNFLTVYHPKLLLFTKRLVKAYTLFWQLFRYDKVHIGKSLRITKARHLYWNPISYLDSYLLLYLMLAILASLMLKCLCDPANFKALKIFSISCLNLDFVASSLLLKKHAKNMVKLSWKCFTFSAESIDFFQ